ncbi:hypothetical protein ACWEBX_14415 [Streptomyces sp. NPDC005070]
MPKPIPRDLPDQQAEPGEDPLDVVGVPGPSTGSHRPEADGRARHSGTSRPEHPATDESSA